MVFQMCVVVGKITQWWWIWRYKCTRSNCSISILCNSCIVNDKFHCYGFKVLFVCVCSCWWVQVLKKAILEDLVRLGKASGLHSFEQVGAVCITGTRRLSTCCITGLIKTWPITNSLFLWLFVIFVSQNINGRYIRIMSYTEWIWSA